MTEAQPLPPLPIAEPPLDRSQLLLAVIRAASAATLGEDHQAAQRELAGDRFELRIRFGCPGRAPRSPETFAVRYEPETRTLRLRAAPNLTLEDPWIAALAGENVEGAEGFWLRHPWHLSAGCPPVARTLAAPAEAAQDELNLTETAQAAATQAAAEPPDPPAATQRVGIAQFFTEADPRTGRRDERAYEVTKVLGAEQQPSNEGYNLVLSGRLRRLPGGRVISCRVVSLDVPPDCVIAAEFGRVWIETPATKEVLAEWGR